MKRFSIVLLLVINLWLVSSTHFRFGHINWENTGLGNGRRTRFTIDTAWRRTFFNDGNFMLGDELTEAARFFPDENRNDEIQLRMTVNVINIASDWFIGQQMLEFDYNSNGMRTASFERCCRISTLLNNPDGDFRIETRVNIASGQQRRGIVSTAIPIVTVQLGSTLNFIVPAIAEDDPFIRYRLSSARQAAGDGANDYRQVNGLTVDAETGIVNWLASERGLQSTQILIEGFNTEADANNRARVQSNAVVDFIINVIDTTDRQCKKFCQNPGNPCIDDNDCINCIDNGMPGARPHCDFNFAPEFDLITVGGVSVPFDPTVAENVQILIAFGAELDLLVRARDPDEEDMVLITSTTLPTGAVATQDMGNPGSLRILWTPPPAQIGAVICFTAADTVGRVSPGQLCVEIRIDPGDLEVTGPEVIVAGEVADYIIESVDGRVHGATMVGPQQATAVVSSGTTPYTARFNGGPASARVTTAGFFAFTATDNTPGAVLSAPVSFIVRVVPAATDPPNALLSNQDSTGLSGGIAGQTVSFAIRSRDEFDNEILFIRGDSYSIEYSLDRGNNPTMTANAVFDADQALHIVTYQVPQTNNEDTYTINIYYQDTQTTPTPPRVAVATRTATAFGQLFQASLEFQSTTFMAGDEVTFTIVGEDNGHQFSASILGDAGTVGNPSNSRYPVSGVIVTQAGTFADGVVVTAPGLSGQVDETIFVLPGSPFAQNCIAEGENLDEGVVGELVEVEVRLADRFMNQITTNVITVRLTVAYPSGAAFTRTLAFTESDRNWQTTFRYTEIGSSTIDIFLVDGPTLTSINGYPRIINIAPAVFSLAQSGLVGPTSFVAGTEQNAFLVARDEFQNLRAALVDADQDQFNAEMVLLSDDDEYVTTVNWDYNGAGEYAFFLSGTRAGEYELSVSVLLPSQGAFVTSDLQTIPINIVAADPVPSNSGLSGGGLGGGVDGATGQILFQTRDRFDNVVEFAGDSLFIASIDTAFSGIVLYEATYNEPQNPIGGQSTGFNWNLWTPFNFQTSSELLLADQGYWIVEYPIPPSASDSNYTISIYYADSSERGEDETLEEIIVKPSTQQIYEGGASSRPRSNSGLISPLADNWQAIVIGVSAGAVFLSAVGYGAYRLQRYRPKYLEERARANSAERVLVEMKDEMELIPGQRDWEALGAATVKANPLHEAYQLKHKPHEELQHVGAEDNLAKIDRQAIRKEFKPTQV